MRFHGLMHVELIQLVPYNFGDHRWKVTALSAWSSNPEDQIVQALSLILKKKNKTSINSSAFFSSLLGTWPPLSSIHSAFCLGLLLPLTYFKKAFFLVWWSVSTQVKLYFFLFSPYKYKLHSVACYTIYSLGSAGETQQKSCQINEFSVRLL